MVAKINLKDPYEVRIAGMRALTAAMGYDLSGRFTVFCKLLVIIRQTPT
jgi:hypothetical protein